MANQPLYSTLQDDPEMAELIEFFLDELDRRTVELTEAWQNTDAEQLRVMAHQLKGAAEGYGYPSITAAARELEQAIHEQESELSSLSEKVEGLVQLCRQASAARPPGGNE